MILDNIKEKIELSNSIVILTHETPDGDAIRFFNCYVYCIKKNGKKKLMLFCLNIQNAMSFCHV